MARHFSSVLRVQSHALLLFATVPLCFLGYHIWLVHWNVGLSSWAPSDTCWIKLPNCSKSKKWHSTAISSATSAFKHFTVQKRWKLWSCFLLLFKEKINAVITLVRFPSWKHGHEIRLLGFHFDGGMSEWYWEDDVQPCSMHLVWIIYLSVKHVWWTAVSKIIEKSNQRVKLQVRVFHSATDCMQILDKYILFATPLHLCTCVWQLCAALTSKLVNTPSYCWKSSLPL